MIVLQRTKSMALHARYQQHKQLSNTFYWSQLLLGSTATLFVIVYTLLRVTRQYRRHLRHQRQLKQSYSKFQCSVRIGIDIGGTLCKLVIYEPNSSNGNIEHELYKKRVSEFLYSSTTYGETGRRDVGLVHSSPHINGILHFIKFPTSSMSRFIEMVLKHKLVPDTVLNNQQNNDSTRLTKSDSIWNQLTDKFANTINPNNNTKNSNTSNNRDTSTNSITTVPVQHSAPHDNACSNNTGNINGVSDKSVDVALNNLSQQYNSQSTDISTQSKHTTHHTNNTTISNGVNRLEMSLDPSNHNNHAMLPLQPAVLNNNNTAGTVLPSESPVFPTFHSMWDAKPNERSTSAPVLDLNNTQQSHNNNTTKTQSSNNTTNHDNTTQQNKSDEIQSLHHTTTEYYDDSGFTDTDANSIPSVCATGGGAYKFASILRQRLKIRLCISDELSSLVRGIDILLHSYQHECYYLKKFRFREQIEIESYNNIKYPYLVVNIGSGVSILRVSGVNDYKRVGGTSLGGGTFYGLCRALTNCTSFQQALQWAEQGRSSPVDLLVGDIYGGNYTALNLNSDTVASSFGKLVRPNAFSTVTKEDLAKACLIMITNNIGSLANLYAHKVMNWSSPQIIFVGNFLNDNNVARRTLAYATDYWSQGQAKALFLKHEGYFGAVGALC